MTVTTHQIGGPSLFPIIEDFRTDPRTAWEPKGAGTMDTADIQKRLDALVLAMLAKGLREPRASARLISNEQPSAGIEWKDATKPYGTAYEYPRADTVAGALDEAAAIISAMPEAQQRKLNDFMAAVGKVIDLGRETGIEAEFVNPLVITMKKLSENALTHHKVAAE